MSVPCEGERYCPVPSREPGGGRGGHGRGGGGTRHGHHDDDGGGTWHFFTGVRAAAAAGAGRAGGRRRGEPGGRRRGFLIPLCQTKGANSECRRAWALIFDFFLVSGAALCSAIRLTHVQHPQPFKGVRRDTPKGFFFFPFSFWVEDIKEVSVVWQFC